MQRTIFGYKILFLTKFLQNGKPIRLCKFKSTAIITQHFLDNPAFLTLGVAVPNTINTAEFCLECHIWLEIQNSITIIRGYLWLFKILVNLNFFLDAVLLA